MEKFLKQIASYLLSKYQSDLVELTIVFPNRRAGIFFQKYLSQLIDAPLFSPKITTISELVTNFTPLRTDDPNSLIIELWRVYSKTTSTQESLDDFYFWGEMMLSDFNDIDKYLVDAGDLFRNIQSLKEIDYGFDYLSEEQLEYLSKFWRIVLDSKGSDDKISFLSIWEKLYPIYLDFKTKLQSEGRAFEGMLYRDVVENLDQHLIDIEGENFAFIGFNALNKCEKKIFSFLKNNASTDFFWDYDEYYLKDDHNEASLFMKSNLYDFPMPDDFIVSFDNFSKLKAIDVISVPSFSGQASYASNWIEKNKATINSQFDNTALVLCDESLLLPMLNCLPFNVDEINITMGFPVKNSSVYGLIKGIVDIDRNCRKNERGDSVFYYRNVLSLLNHPLLHALLSEITDELNLAVQKENKIYLTIGDLDKNPISKSIFTIPDKASDIKDYLHKILSNLLAGIPNEDVLVKESIYQIYLSINRLHDSLFSGEEIPISKRLFFQLLIKSLDRLAIPFEGEPLSGIQLMGFLETRCLDFDNLILLSFNDERLPGKPNQHSFIPYTLRKGFELPVIEQRNAMYSYYFYRLIQRAKTVSLVFDSRSEGMSRGEASRYVTQLKYEANHLNINEIQAFFNFDPAENKTIEIRKDQKVLERITNILRSRVISPTALSTYVDCNLKFYFSYVENIKETEEVAEDIDQLLFGRITHLTLEALYKPFEGKEISRTDIERIIQNDKDIDSQLTVALKQEYFKGGNFNINGKNLLVFEIIKKCIVRILKYDSSIAPFTILGLEKKFNTKINVEAGENTLTIEVGGTIDRLDQVADSIRVVDYKTGKSEVKVKSIESLFEAGYDRNKAAFQTMIYAHCVAANLKTATPILPAVYGARSVFNADFNPLFQFDGGNMIYQANSEVFILLLKQLLLEIIDPEKAFAQTKNANTCKFCPYNLMCKR
jgi:hypothetical protein